jgi:hypothetical protein
MTNGTQQPVKGVQQKRCQKEVQELKTKFY